VKSTSEIKALAKHLFSANRREKVQILAKEGLLALLPRNDAGTLDLSRLPPDPAVHTWKSEQSRAIDADFYRRATVRQVEDHLVDDSVIVAAHDHELHQLYGATSYTNESTHRTIFDRTGQRIDSLSYRRPNTRGTARRRLGVARTVSGVTANLYGTKACAEGNYAHWLVDAVARLFMIEQTHRLEDVDYVLVPPLKYDFQWDSLAALGFGRDRVVQLKPLECLQFECLLASSSPRGKGSAICPDWVVDRYHETLFSGAAAVPSLAGKRVYISRRDAPNRKFLNEDEVCEVLSNRGFDIVELSPLDLWSKIAVFRDADCIISQTGAGLTNLMFCQSGAKVVELVDTGFVYPMYASLAAYRGAIHHAHYFSNDSALGRVNTVVAKSSLNVEALTRFLDELQI